jgi:hypothetical protein
MDIVPVVGRDKDGKEDSSEQWSPFKLKVREPGMVRKIVSVIPEPSSIIPTVMGKPVAADMTPVPAVVFEIDPEGVERMREFAWLGPGVKLTIPGKMVFLDSYIDEVTRNPMFLYEVHLDKKGA